jgi:signal transduction histidine kinase
MVDRLRGSTARLRDAERRAAVGDIARQVNHDIKNGLAPIRNVVRHLAEVARDQPQALPAIFAERQGTLDSSIAYLDTLARNYARLSPSLATSASDPASVIADAVGGAEGRGATVRTRCAAGLPRVAADAVVMRRIIENLVANAIDSLEGKPGEVIISADQHAAPHPMVRIVVADNGRGMSEAELGRAFDDFYTTKPDGTGLGLSVVRRLVADLGGALRVETEPGTGTQVLVDLPTVPPHPNPPRAAPHQ